MKESSLKIRVIKYLKSCPDIWFAKLDDRTHKGYPDFIGVIGNADRFGIFFTIELKKKGEEPDPLQAYTLKSINEHGGHAFWSSSFDEIKSEIEDLRRIYSLNNY